MLKAKAKSAVFWSMVSSFGSIIIQIVYGIIMARLLTPYDFGLIAMAMVVITISRSLVDSGFYQAVIQKKEVNRDELSAVFKFNLILALLLSTSIFLFSNKLAQFFGERNLSEIFSLLALTIILEAFSLIQRAILIKEIKFKLISKIEIFSLLVSSVLAILLALNDFGVYSLVYKALVQVLLTTLCYWVFHPLKVNLLASFNYLKVFLNFGSKVFVADQIEVISNQITYGIIGKRFNSSDLGFFTKASQYQSLISQTAIVSINKVVFPTLSKIQDDDVKLKSSYRILIKLSSFFIFPIMFIAIINGKEFVSLLLGDQWEQSIPYFKILCIGGLFYPFTVFNLNIIKVKGLGTMYLKVCLITKGALLPMVLIGLNFGIVGISIAIITHQIFAATVNSSFSGKLIDYSLRMQIKDVFPSFISAIIALVAGLQVYSYLDEMLSPYTIVIKTLLFVLIYLSSLYIIAKKEIVMMYKTIVEK